MSESIGILITSYEGHLPYLDKCLWWVGESGLPAVIGWDSPNSICETDEFMKAKPENLFHWFSTGKRLGLQQGEKRQIVEGLDLLQKHGTEWVFKASGDQTVQHPEKIELLPKMLAEASCDMAYHRSKNEGVGQGGRIETKTFFAGITAFQRLLKAHEFDPARKRKIQADLFRIARRMDIVHKSMRLFWRDELKWWHYHSHKPHLMERRKDAEK